MNAWSTASRRLYESASRYGRGDIQTITYIRKKTWSSRHPPQSQQRVSLGQEKAYQQLVKRSVEGVLVEICPCLGAYDTENTVLYSLESVAHIWIWYVQTRKSKSNKDSSVCVVLRDCNICISHDSGRSERSC